MADAQDGFRAAAARVQELPLVQGQGLQLRGATPHPR